MSATCVMCRMQTQACPNTATVSACLSNLARGQRKGGGGGLQWSCSGKVWFGGSCACSPMGRGPSFGRRSSGLWGPSRVLGGASQGLAGLLTSRNDVPPRLWTHNADNFLVQAQTSAQTRKHQAAHLLSLCGPPPPQGVRQNIPHGEIRLSWSMTIGGYSGTKTLASEDPRPPLRRGGWS